LCDTFVKRFICSLVRRSDPSVSVSEHLEMNADGFLLSVFSRRKNGRERCPGAKRFRGRAVFTDRRTPAAGLATNSPADLRRPGTNSNLFGERKLNSIIFQKKKGEFWGCSRAVTRSRAESEVASLGGFVRCLRNRQRPLLCPGWERPQNERRATGSDSEVAPLGWRKKRKGAGRWAQAQQEAGGGCVGGRRRGVACPSPHPEIVELVAASRRRPPYVFSRPARALTETETETSLLDSCWFGI